LAEGRGFVTVLNHWAAARSVNVLTPGPARRHVRGTPPRTARTPGRRCSPACTPSDARAPGSSGARRTTAHGSPRRRCGVLRRPRTGTRRRSPPCPRSGCDRPLARRRRLAPGIARRGARGGVPPGVPGLCRNAARGGRRRAGRRRLGRCSRCRTVARAGAPARQRGYAARRPHARGAGRGPACAPRPCATAAPPPARAPAAARSEPAPPAWDGSARSGCRAARSG